MAPLPCACHDPGCCGVCMQGTGLRWLSVPPLGQAERHLDGAAQDEEREVEDHEEQQVVGAVSPPVEVLVRLQPRAVRLGQMNGLRPCEALKGMSQAD